MTFHFLWISKDFSSGSKNDFIYQLINVTFSLTKSLFFSLPQVWH